MPQLKTFENKESVYIGTRNDDDALNLSSSESYVQ